MASPIVFSGLASGIDSEALVSALVNQAKTPINRLQTQKTALSTQSRKLTDIKTKLTNLQNAAKALDSKGEALSNKATSSDEKILKATAAGGTAMGTFKVEVTSLAQAQRTYSAAVASDSTEGLAGTGKLTIQVGTGTTYEVDVTDTDSLAEIASKINSSGAAVSAGVVKEGSSYRLQVTAKETGAANAVTFTEDGTLALGLSTAELEPTDPNAAKLALQATDAVVKVDGFSFSSATNALTSAVPGVTLNLVEKGISTVQVDRSPDELKTKLNSFVTAFNDVMKTLNSEFASVPGLTKGAESLNGDSTVRSLQSTLRRVLSSVADNGDSSITTLASLGVAVTRDGTLSFDDSKFTKAVTQDYEGIATALAGLTDGSGLMTKVSEAIDPFSRTDGSLRSRIDTIATRTRGIDRQVDSMQVRLDKYESQLRAQYAALESTIGKMQAQGNSLSGLLSF